VWYNIVYMFVLCCVLQVDDANMELEKQRSSVLAMEKKHRKFDQLLNEEKNVSQRYKLHHSNIKS